MGVLGDLNGRLGDSEVQGVIGDYGVSGMNESGEWMFDWCMQYKMTLCDTLFKKRDVRRVTGEIVDLSTL